MGRAQWWRTVWQLWDTAARRGRRAVRRSRLWVEILERRLAPTVTLSISNPAPFPKPDTGQMLGIFVVTRSGDLAPSILVDCATQDGTGANGAHAGVDYVATTGTLIFAPYQVTATIAVPIIGNNVFQADKTFTVSLSHPVPGITFAPASTFAAGLRRNSVAVGDFNGDGKPDIAVPNKAGSRDSDFSVSVLLNTTPVGASVPSFAPQQTFPTGQYPASVAVGDFNGDGKPDLAVANLYDNTVSVLLNTTPAGATTVSFTPQQTFAVGQHPYAIAVGDFNGDGKPDLITANEFSDSVSVLLNTTSTGATVPSFAAQRTFSTGAYPVSVAVGDINGDGKPDITVANAVLHSFNYNAVSVLLNTTPAGATIPSFAPQQTVLTDRYATSVALADFNGDGKPDLAVARASFTGRVVVLLNTTPAGATVASFTLQGPYDIGFGGGPRSLVVGDFNGDGKPDLAFVNTVNSNGALSLLLNTTPRGAATLSFTPEQNVFENGGFPISVAVGDFNGDGKPDFAVANSTPGSVSVLLNESPPITLIPSFTPQQTFATGFTPDGAVVADINGDGKPDLVTSNEFDNSVSVLLNTTPAGATVPSFMPQQTFAAGHELAFIAVGDFNGDGKPDLVVANYNDQTVSILLNTTPTGATVPSFAPQQTFFVGDRPNAVAVGDFNGDGKPDLVIANFSFARTVSVLLNTTPTGATTASFAPRQTFAAGVAYCVSVADLNGDGKPDLVVVNNYGRLRNGGVSVLLNTTLAGATVASFAAQQAYATGEAPVGVAVGDINGDGKPDLAVANYTSSTVSVLLNTTPAGATVPSFRPQQTFTTANRPRSIVLGDFTGDGKPDLALPNFGSHLNSISVLFNTTEPRATTPSFAPLQIFTAGGGPTWVAIGDFNGDAKPDLAVTNYTGTVSVLMNSLPIMLDGSLAIGTISSAPESPTAAVAVPGTTPQSSVVNTAFAVPLAVDVRDAAGHLIQGVSVTFTAPASGPGGLFGNAISVTVVTNASGRATAPAFVANTLAGTYMVTAQAAGGSNPTASFSLTNTPAAASSFTLTGLPPSLVAGTPSTLTVTARDPFNNIATGYTGTVRFLSTDPNATLPPNYTFTAADHGVHTFMGLILQTVGIHFVTAYDTVDLRIDGISPGIRVLAAAADHLAVTTAAADPDVAGTPFDVSVTVQDAYGNTVPDYTGTVTFSSADPYPALLPDDYTFTSTDQGTVTFPGGATLYTAGTWDITATDTSSGITGAAFVNVVAAPAVAFQVLAPASATSGTPFDVTVVAVDAYGNTDTYYQGTVTFSTSDGDPGVVLPPDYTFQPADAGMATFPGGVTLITPGDQLLTITDTDSGIMGSTTITVSGPGAARSRTKTGGWDTIRADAFDGLFAIPGRRRRRGPASDELLFDSPG